MTKEKIHLASVCVVWWYQYLAREHRAPGQTLLVFSFATGCIPRHLANKSLNDGISIFRATRIAEVLYFETNIAQGLHVFEVERQFEREFIMRSFAHSGEEESVRRFRTRGKRET